MSHHHLEEMQKTLARSVQLRGRGIFTGLDLTVTIRPSPENSGIVFRRTDIVPNVDISLKVDNVQEASRCTCVGVGSAKIFMVEHLLSALYACEIDNALIEVTGPEVPGLDGSSKEFVLSFLEAGFVFQEAPKVLLIVDRPIFYSSGNVHLVALPSDVFKISYTLHYPNSKLIKSQFFSCIVSSEFYRDQIASSRTFSIYEEVISLIEKGLIKGGGLDNALVIKDDVVVNPEGLRFSDEMVRHKVLDLIGDLSFVGSKLCAHVIAICSGHASNIAFARRLLETFQPRSLSCPLGL